MRQQVQCQSTQGEGAAETERQRRETHVLDAGIREQSLDVVLGHDERQRHGQAEQAEGHQDGRRQLRADGACGDRLEAGQGIQRDDERSPRQEGRDGAGRLTVRVWQPGVERCEAGLGAVADQHEDEG